MTKKQVEVAIGERCEATECLDIGWRLRIYLFERFL